jgi:outer membrane protein OmpU
MKKILLTTTALTMLAGAAAADISISGTARMGVSHNAAGANAGTTVNNRMRVNFNGSGETDGGLTFGAHLRIQSGGNVTAGAATWISNGTMTLTVGNTNDAIRQTGGIWGCGVGFVGGIICGDTGGLLGSSSGNSSTAAGVTKVRLDFALGSANVSISGGAAQDNQIAASFAAGAATINIGWDQGNASGTATQHVAVSFDAGSANLRALYAKVGAASNYVLAATLPVGAGSAYAYVGNVAGVSVYGANYSHNLGGGATFKIGAEHDGAAAVDWDAGVTFSF